MWVSLILAESIRAKTIVSYQLGEHELIIWKSKSEYVVMDARCPHLWAHLGHEGLCDGKTVTCTAHYWSFDSTGFGWKQSLDGRCDEKSPIRVYGSRVFDSMVQVLCDDQGAPQVM